MVDGSNSQDLTNHLRQGPTHQSGRLRARRQPVLHDPSRACINISTRWVCATRSGAALTPDGQLLLGDVGQNTWEEINLVSAGANFGWPYAEGVCPGSGVCQPPDSDGKTNPIYAYQHEPVGGSSITSVLVYEGDGFGDRYENAVFFADFNKGWVKVMHCDAGYTSCGAPSTFIPRPAQRPGWSRGQTATSIN